MIRFHCWAWAQPTKADMGEGVIIRQWIGLIGLSLWIPAVSGFALQSQNEMDCERHYCAAVIDAGSSGSRIHWYTYDHDRQHHPIHIHETFSKKIKPGLANLKHDSDSIDRYLSQLMQDFSRPQVPIYFYATAGMRLLSSTEQNHVYSEISNWFAQHPQWPLQEARTITGMEEGIFGWLSLNYHLHALQDKSLPLAGLIEVGGASAQVAFPIQNTTEVDAQDYTDLEIYGRHIHLYSHSFLGLGINELFAHSQNYLTCFPMDYPLLNGSHAVGDAKQCQNEIGTVLQQDYHVNTLIKPALQHNTAPIWYTVSAVSVMVSAPPFAFDNQEFTGSALLEQADAHYCQQAYSNLTTRYPEGEYSQKNCLLAAYFSGLMSYGLGFEAQQEIHYAADYDGSWAMGALLSKMTDFNSEAVRPEVQR